MKFRFLHGRRNRYEAAAQQAEREVRASRKRLDDTRREVVRPLAEEKRHNQFADIIRVTLINGYHHRKA